MCKRVTINKKDSFGSKNGKSQRGEIRQFVVRSLTVLKDTGTFHTVSQICHLTSVLLTEFIVTRTHFSVYLTLGAVPTRPGLLYVHLLEFHSFRNTQSPLFPVDHTGEGDKCFP